MANELIRANKSEISYYLAGENRDLANRFQGRKSRISRLTTTVYDDKRERDLTLKSITLTSITFTSFYIRLRTFRYPVQISTMLFCSDTSRRPSPIGVLSASQYFQCRQEDSGAECVIMRIQVHTCWYFLWISAAQTHLRYILNNFIRRESRFATRDYIIDYPLIILKCNFFSRENTLLRIKLYEVNERRNYIFSINFKRALLSRILS